MSDMALIAFGPGVPCGIADLQNESFGITDVFHNICHLKNVIKCDKGMKHYRIRG